MLHASVVKEWMKGLGELLEKYKFPPQLIFNMDETMLDSSGHKVHVLTRAHSPRPFTENEAKLEHISLVLCISASGSFLRPLAIFPLKTAPYLQDEVKNFFSISGQPNGFISNDIWADWIAKIFISHVNKIRQLLNLPQQKALFIVDSHITRKHEPTIKLFEEHNILVYILPSHSSTILQPLDLTVNAEFKRLIRLRFKPIKDEDKPTKRSRVLYKSIECLQGAFLAIHITDRFARAEIWPFSAKASLNSALVKHPDDLINYAPPTKRKRGPKIAGKVLTYGEAIALLEYPKPPPPVQPPPLMALPPPPLKPTPKITPIAVVTF